ncbi:hypothetical protein FS749_005738, partial [Ceratobasidium sp. UAMH 11750]
MLPVVDCCDICVPTLLDLIQPPKASRFKDIRHKRTPKKGAPHKDVQRVLFNWHDKIWSRDHDGMSWGASALLSSPLVDLLSSISPISTYEQLEEIIAHKWGWWNAYSQELFDLLGALSICFEPLPARPSKKCTAEATQLSDTPWAQVPRGSTALTSRHGQRSSGASICSTRTRSAPPTPSASSSTPAPPASFIYLNFNLPAVQSAPAATNLAYTGPPIQHHYYTTSTPHCQPMLGQQLYAPNLAYHLYMQPPFPPIQQPPA